MACFVDVSGKVFGDWRVIKALKPLSSGNYVWLVECVHCGKQKERTRQRMAQCPECRHCQVNPRSHHPGEVVNRWELIEPIDKWRSEDTSIIRWKGKCTNCGASRIDSVSNLAKGSCRICHFKPRGYYGMKMKLAGYKRQAKDHGRDFKLTEDQFWHLTSSPCHYCGNPPASISKSSWHDERSTLNSEWTTYLCNGIDRKDNSRGYILENCLPCCPTCNHAKHTMDYEAFREWISRAAKHLSLVSEQ